ncbi:PGN_0703 family putative restriction endonuclease [Flavobacterium sp. 7A]|uniref:PGN_0703 family putative restriction endonuclease n=1 Tax=Flavobacterium sp. 7A TaxID=2940571 RepID=UPI0022269C36|nr:hypothetical protein [Flavobacterium sp. 7A]MCW2119558.1 hypothetical protein [Flavobacterium sp. 7A]
MATRKYFEKEIIKRCQNPKVNTNGYLLDNSQNLLEGVDIDLFQDDLMSGSGNELKSKFNAVFSSSALAVNNFSIVKKHLSQFNCFNYSNFNEAKFERQFRTGLEGTPPNLDFTIENKDVIIAFESKYLETTEKKEVKFVDSYSKKKLDYLDDMWFDLIKKYKNLKLYLDVAQLIKHSIGLINHKRQNTHQKTILVYLYWTPENHNDYPNFIQHNKELVEFEKDIKKSKDLEFISLTYNEFWEIYDDSYFDEHFKKMRNRYKIRI